MADVNFELARFNMVEQQVRTWEVLDARVLEQMRLLQREDFVPPQYRNLAFTDMEIPLGQGHSMMPPKVVGRMLQVLDVQPRHRVLEVGTGSGYVTALLARLANEGHVYSVDSVPEFTNAARQRLSQHGIKNATLETGNAVNGWDAHEPYDIIAITGSFPVLGESFQKFRDSLKVGGRLFVVVGEAPAMEARLLTRVGEQAWQEKSLFETVLAPLMHASRPRTFSF